MIAVRYKHLGADNCTATARQRSASLRFL